MIFSATDFSVIIFEFSENICYNISMREVIALHINDILELNGLSLELLRQYSFRSQLGLSLKRTLRHFDKAALFAELRQYRNYLILQNIADNTALDYRIKSQDSIEEKYDRYYPNTECFKVFNDILGFRAFCDDYSDIISADSDLLKIIDMSHGKRLDDGYRGVHVYYQIDNYHYQIEIQFNTLFDRQMNNWLHDYVYKKNYPLTLGQQLRAAYENGRITDLHSFEVSLNDLLSCEKQE